MNITTSHVPSTAQAAASNYETEQRQHDHISLELQSLCDNVQPLRRSFMLPFGLISISGAGLAIPILTAATLISGAGVLGMFVIARLTRFFLK